jgi:hypothetical protein
MKCQRDRPLVKEILKPDEPSLLIWQQEPRHPLAYLRSRCSGVALREAADQGIDRGLEVWACAPCLVRKGLQTVGQRKVQVATPEKRLFEPIANFRFHHR